MTLEERNKRINDATSLITKYGYDAVIVTDSDPHLSEYVDEHYRLRSFLSGFDGSNGTLVICKDGTGGLWTDSRYYLQSERQLAGTGIKLFKSEDETITEYLSAKYKNRESSVKVAVDPNVTSYKFHETYFTDTDDVPYIYYDYELDGVEEFFDEELWMGKRPKQSFSNVYIHHSEYTGETTAERIGRVKSEIFKIAKTNDIVVDQCIDGYYYLFSKLDDIAWILNLRSDNGSCTPDFPAYLLLGTKRDLLFANTSSFSSEVKKYLEELGIELREYDSSKEFIDYAPYVFTDYDCISYNLTYSTKNLPNPVSLMKLVKTDTEVRNIDKTMIADGVAMVRLIMWLKENAGKGIRETDVAGKIFELRRESSLQVFGKEDIYRMESFATIAGYNENGAIVHYSAKNGEDSEIEAEGSILVDTGGNYLTGTTDITRVIKLGQVSDEEVKDYTNVLKGHIDLEMAVFPEGTVPQSLDAIPHRHLWKSHRTYQHGTGHGVGFFLGVHEMPLTFGKNGEKVVLKPNMVITNEPGCYVEGKYGIRLENMMVVEKECDGYLRFRPLTLCPFDHELVRYDMLDDSQKSWLRVYHKQVFDTLCPYLNDDERQWLSVETEYYTF